MACDSGRCWLRRRVIAEGESRKEAKRDRVLGPPYVMTLPGPPALALQLMLCPAPSPSAWRWAVLPNARNHSHICPFRAAWWRQAAFGPVRAGRYVLAAAADPLTDKRERNGERVPVVYASLLIAVDTYSCHHCIRCQTLRLCRLFFSIADISCEVSRPCSDALACSTRLTNWNKCREKRLLRARCVCVWADACLFHIGRFQ